MTKIAYFHVPKCAGTTVTGFLAKRFGVDAVLTNSTFIDYFAVPTTYFNKYDVFAGHVTHDCVPLLPMGTSFVTVLRNPCDRLVSLYSYYRLIENREVQPYPVTLAKELDFHDWLESGNPEVIKETANAIVRQFVPSSFFSVAAPACPQNILKVAEDFVAAFGVVGFVEEFEVTMELLAQTYEIPSGTSAAAGRLNASGSENVQYSRRRLNRYLEEHSWLDLEFVRYCLAIFRRQCPTTYRSRLADIERRVLGA